MITYPPGPLPENGKGEKDGFFVEFCARTGAKTPQAGQTSDYESPERQNQDGYVLERRAGERGFFVEFCARNRRKNSTGGLVLSLPRFRPAYFAERNRGRLGGGLPLNCCAMNSLPLNRNSGPICAATNSTASTFELQNQAGYVRERRAGECMRG